MEQIQQLVCNEQKEQIVPIYVMCRRGMASVAGTKKLLAAGFAQVINVDGGVTQWQKQIDANFPTY